MFDFSKSFQTSKILKKRNVGMFCVFVKEIVILNIGFGFWLFNSIWEHRLKISFDPQNRPLKKNNNQKCEQFSYGTFGVIFWGFLVPLRR